ncbi:hypothetical protein ACRAWF_24880 [Streptomyces sp. L7]
MKIAWIDPLSGLMAPVGQNQAVLPVLRREVQRDEPGRREVRDHPDRQQKLSPAESLNALKSAIDQGVRYVTVGNAWARRWRSSTPSTSTTSAIPARRSCTSTTGRDPT